MNRTPAAEIPLAPSTIKLLLVSLALVLAPHLTHLPILISLFCIVFGLWRLMASTHGWPLPGKISRLLLTLLVMAVVIMTYGTIIGPDPGTALLTAMLGLKLLETRRPRDAALVITLGYFLTVTMALYSQSIALAIYMLVVILLLTATLIKLNQFSSHRVGSKPIRLAAKLFLQAVPLMIVMFLLFPRLPGPLWGFPPGASSGTTGLSEEMTPGSISNLGQSDAVAFRVKFDGPTPNNSLLYWRGPVLWATNGKSWTPGPRKSTHPTGYPIPKRVPVPQRVQDGLVTMGQEVSYQVTLEPHPHNWLYALDVPTSIPDGAMRSPDYQLLANEPVMTLVRYRVTSHTRYRMDNLSPDDRQQALQLVAGSNLKAQAMGRKWRSEFSDDAQLVQHALSYFHDEHFYYTLKPPLLKGDTVDEFLFNTRRGFCEHYAASFTVLMRAAGIPTRIVTGYQGGEANPVGDYLVVRQRDAHAWTEVWLGDQGWVRIDPTAAVAPARIEKGIDSILEESRQGIFNYKLAGNVWGQLRNGFDVLNNGWNQWVLGYQSSLQNQLLASLGLLTWQGKTVGVIFGLGLLLSLIAGLLLRHQNARQDPVTAAYRRFCYKLARRGLARAPTEGPINYADRIVTWRPDLAEEVVAINQMYIALQYGENPTTSIMRRFYRRIRAFKP